MKYISGQEVKIGDCVAIEYGKTDGIVHAIIEAEEHIKEWGVDEPGLMISSKPFGLVFWPESEVDDPVIFGRR